MIYVDSAIYKKSPNGRKTYAHMVATTVEELCEFAKHIGVKKHFWHSQGKLSHFDITSDQCEVALNNGAMLVDSRQLVSFAKLMNGEKDERTDK